jgi:hypothetical protein
VIEGRLRRFDHVNLILTSGVNRGRHMSRPSGRACRRSKLLRSCDCPLKFDARGASVQSADLGRYLSALENKAEINAHFRSRVISHGQFFHEHLGLAG